MTEPGWLLLSAAAWVRQISWHVTCGYRKCSPGSNGVWSNVWLCLNSPCVSPESLLAMRASGYEPWERNAPKGPWGSSRPNGVLNSSATYFCLFRQKLLGFVHQLTVPKCSGIPPTVAGFQLCWSLQRVFPKTWNKEKRDAWNVNKSEGDFLFVTTWQQVSSKMLDMHANLNIWYYLCWYRWS